MVKNVQSSSLVANTPTNELKYSEEMWTYTVAKYSKNFSEKMRIHLVTEFSKLVNEVYWSEEDTPVISGSMQTFMKVLLKLNPKDLPSIGCDHDGNILMSWNQKESLCTFTCLPNDKIWWHISFFGTGKPNYSIGKCRFNEFETKFGTLGFGNELRFEI